MLAPILQRTVQPFLIDTIGHAPLIGRLFAGPPYGIGTLTAGIILAVMVLPIILMWLIGVHFWRVQKDGGLTVEEKHGREEQRV